MIGVDGGTESLRAFVFDLSGNILGTVATVYPTRFPRPGRAEQDPADWWTALGQSVRGAVAQAGVGPDEVEALALATTCCSVVALDAAGKALRPSLIWMDVRAGDEAAAVLETGDIALEVNGGGRGPVSAESMIPKSLWLQRHEPDVFARAATICEYQDYLNFHLTGRRCASLNNASVRWHYATKRGGPPSSLLRKLGLGALAEKWPAEVVAPGEVVGTLTQNASAYLGLSPSVRVVQGGADALIGMIGLGVAAPGQMALITGSSHLQLGVTDRSIHAPGIWGTYRDAVYPGLEIVEGGQTSTGSIIAWLQRLSGGKLDMDMLNREAAYLPPGADGLLVLDHFQGNRTPYTDPLSRGAIVGLSLGHGPAHIFRAIMEGIGMGTRAILDAMARAGIAVGELVVAGGATRSDLWLQIHADTAGVPVVVPRVPDAPGLGAAILAAVGAGHFATIQEGCAAMVSRARLIEPQPATKDAYAELYARYLALYPTLKPLLPPMKY
jgi:ribulose kinase